MSAQTTSPQASKSIFSNSKPPPPARATSSRKRFGADMSSIDRANFAIDLILECERALSRRNPRDRDRNDKQEKTTTEYGKLDRRCALMPCGPSAICGFSQPIHAATTTVGDCPLRPRSRIPREAKSPPSAVLRSSLRPARASRVLARLARLLSAATRGTDGMSRRPEETERRNEHP